jgi:hypothetical protein
MRIGSILSRSEFDPFFVYGIWRVPDPNGTGLTPVVRSDWMATREDMVEWTFGWDRKNRGPISQQVWHDKDPPCSKALSAERRPKFYSPSPAMVTSPYEWKILEWDVKS